MMKRSTLVLLGFTGICGVVVSATAGSVAANPSGGALPPALTLVVSGADAGVPDDAIGLALNVTVTNPMAAGFLTVYPCDQSEPSTSNLNYVKDQTVPNMVITAVDGNGDACIDTLAVTDVVVDVAGYVPAGSGLTMLAAPQRFLDTRDGTGAPKSRVKGGTELRVPVAGGHGVPGNAGAVVFNATVVNAAGGGFLTVYPCGQPTPTTSTLNFAAGGVVPNLVTSALGPSGDVCFFANVDVDIVGDVAGYFAGSSAGVTLLSKPERIVDSRDGTGGPQAKVTLTPRPVQVTGVAGVPAGASAALVNLTATNGVAPGWLAAYPCDTAPPEVSNLNFNKNQNVANAAVVKLAADGTFCVRANQAVDLVVDVTGYTTGAQWIVPLPPKRIYDTRNQVRFECHRAIIHIRATDQRWWVDLTTGSLGAPIPNLNETRIISSMISSDCRHFEVVYGGANGTTYQLKIGLDGSLTARVLDPDYTYRLSDLGLVAFDGIDTVFLYDTDETLFVAPDLSTPELLRTWRLDDVSRDGSTFLLRVSPEWQSMTRIAFGADGRVLAGVPLGLTHLSPDGEYFIDTSSACPNGLDSPDCGTGFTISVKALDGTVVDSITGGLATPLPLITGPSWVDAVWIGPGMLLAEASVMLNKCGTSSWELFNSPVKLPDASGVMCVGFDAAR